MLVDEEKRWELRQLEQAAFQLPVERQLVSVDERRRRRVRSIAREMPASVLVSVTATKPQPHLAIRLGDDRVPECILDGAAGEAKPTLAEWDMYLTDAGLEGREA